MKGYTSNVEKETINNKNFRKVAYTSHYMQLVYMTLKPGEDIGMERHASDQFFRIEEGEGDCIIDGIKHKIKDGFGIIVPSNAEHNIVNTSKSKSLSLYTIYALPNHKDGIVAATKEKAESMKEYFDGKVSE